MRAKIKTQKNPKPNFRAVKISRKQNKFGSTLFTELRGRDTRVLQYHESLNTHLKSGHPKKYLPNFPAQKILEWHLL